MSCRETKANSAVTSLAHAVSGLPDNQVQAAFHALKRSPDAEQQDAPDPVEYQNFLNQQRNLLDALPELDKARRRSIRERLDDAFADATRPDAALPDAATFYALRNVTAETEIRADQARKADLAARLPAMTPPDVDAELAEQWNGVYRVWDKLDEAKATLERMRRYRHSDPDEQQRVLDRIQTLRAQSARLIARTKPYDDEWERRGRWSRAYLVDNPNGHLHRSRACSQCFPTTRFYWVTELSGKDEQEIVEQAGADACTTCYPSAPVETLNRPSQIDSPRRAEQRAAQEERARRTAERAAKRILDPATGQPLRVIERSFRDGTLRPGAEFKTERGAEIEAVQGLASKLWYGDDHPSAPAWDATARAVAEAIAAKHGEPVDAVMQRLEAKAEAKHRRDSR